MDTTVQTEQPTKHELTQIEARKALIAIQPACNWSQRTVWIEDKVYELNFVSEPTPGVMRLYTELEALVLANHPNLASSEPITWQYGGVGQVARELTWGKLQGILSAQRAAAKVSEPAPKKEKKASKAK